jgi:DNA-binding transcriptional LysR family regulator
MNRALKTFIAAARVSSFSIAGSTLGLTQSAVSSQMKKLEEDLNCRLFDRLGKAVALSARGRELLPTAQEIVRLYESMKGQSADADIAGRLDLGAITTVQMGLLPEALRAFRQQFAAVEVNVVPGTSVQLLSHIDARELDFAVMIKPSLKLPKDLRWTPLLKEIMSPLRPAGSRNSLSTSCSEPIHSSATTVAPMAGRWSTASSSATASRSTT